MRERSNKATLQISYNLFHYDMTILHITGMYPLLYTSQLEEKHFGQFMKLDPNLKNLHIIGLRI